MCFLSFLLSLSLSFLFFFFFNTPNKSRLFSRALLCVHVWIPSQIIPEWLKGGCLRYVMAGQQKGPLAASLFFSLFRLDHILVMGRTINGRALMPKAAPPPSSFQWIQMDLYLAMYWWKSLLSFAGPPSFLHGQMRDSCTCCNLYFSLRFITCCAADCEWAGGWWWWGRR